MAQPFFVPQNNDFSLISASKAPFRYCADDKENICQLASADDDPSLVMASKEISNNYCPTKEGQIVIADYFKICPSNIASICFYFAKNANVTYVSPTSDLEFARNIVEQRFYNELFGNLYKQIEAPNDRTFKFVRNLKHLSDKKSIDIMLVSHPDLCNLDNGFFANVFLNKKDNLAVGLSEIHDGISNSGLIVTSLCRQEKFRKMNKIYYNAGYDVIENNNKHLYSVATKSEEFPRPPKSFFQRAIEYFS